MSSNLDSLSSVIRRSRRGLRTAYMLIFNVHVRCMSSSVRCRLSVCLSSVTFVRPTQAIEISAVPWPSMTFQ